MDMTEYELKAIVQANIKRYRNYRGWTQAQLAEKLNISINFLSDIENGKKWISPATMVKFASVLNIEPFELFRPPEAPEPAVSALLSRYNGDVVQAVSESLERLYRYYQKRFDAQSTSGEATAAPKEPEGISPYETFINADQDGMAAENQ